MPALYYSDSLPYPINGASPKAKMQINLGGFVDTNNASNYGLGLNYWIQAGDSMDFSSDPMISALCFRRDSLTLYSVDNLINNSFTFYILPWIPAGGTGISEEELISVTVAPNPIRESFEIRSNETELKEFTLFDVYGKIVMSQTDIDAVSVKIPTYHLQQGYYILKITNFSAKSTTIKLLKI